MYPCVEYDRNGMVYITLSDSNVEKSTESEDGLFVFDTDTDGNVVGIEIVSVDRLRDICKSESTT